MGLVLELRGRMVLMVLRGRRLMMRLRWWSVVRGRGPRKQLGVRCQVIHGRERNMRLMLGRRWVRLRLGVGLGERLGMGLGM